MPLDTFVEVDRAPVTHGQEQWWLQYLLQPQNAAHNIALPVRLKGPFDLTAFEQAINALIQRHDVLRTTVQADGLHPVQVIVPFASRSLQVVDLQHLPHAQREAAAMGAAEEDARKPFNLEEETLFRVQVVRLAPEDHLCLLTSHHAISDGWSLDLLLRELAVLYNAALAGEESPLEPLPLTHANFARRQQSEYAAQEDAIRSQIEYWCNRLQDADATLNLPTDRPRPAAQTHRGANFHFDLPQPLVAELKERSREDGVTLFMTLLAAFSVWLSRQSNQTDLTVGSAIANRSARDTRNLLGFLVNTVALRQDLSGDPPFREMMHRARQEVVGAFQNPDVPFRRLVEELQPERDPSQSPLFQAFLVSLPFIGDYEFTDLEKELLRASSHACLYDVLLQVLTREHARSNNLTLKLNYNTDLFDAGTAERMAARFERLLEGVAASTHTPISQLPLIPDEERAQLLEWSRGQSLEYSVTAHVEELVASQVEQTPSATAIETEDGGTLTYRELFDRAQALAGLLREKGAGPNERVAICIDRSLSLPVAVLGALLSGAAYVPLDPSYPLARLRAMFEDAAPCALLTTSALATRFGASAEEVAQSLPALFLDDQKQPATTDSSTRDASHAGQDDLAYLLYTSGSTGQPKGVAMPHRALVNLVRWQTEQSRQHGNAAPITLQFAPLGFDVSFQEIFSTLHSGGKLLMISEETRRDPFALLEVLREKKVERLFLPFVALQQLAFAAARRNVYPTSLREVASAGESLLVTPEIRAFFENLPGCVLHNHYGPTEAHVVTSLTLAGSAEDWPERPTVGRPIDNALIQILDAGGDISPIGVPGELVIGDAPLAHGYWKQPERTAEKFRDTGNERLFYTGDVARWKNDGTVEFLGRRDAQIKVRGHRVELGEIEAALSAHPAVREAVVIGESQANAQDSEGNAALTQGETRLLACIVTDDPKLQGADLRRMVREQLPDYMVPSEFLLVASLPLTPSGKLDRRALAALRTGPVEPTYEPPQSDLEQAIARAWCEVLGVPRVGRHDNFFELGGHSLLGTLVVSRLRDELKLQIPLYHLFEAPTIEEFAARIATIHATYDPDALDSFDEGRL